MIDAWCRGALRLLDGVNAVGVAMGYLAGLNFLLISLFITVDVLGRKFAGISSAVTDEMGGYALVFGSTTALSFAMATGAHVRIDILLPKFPPRLRAILNYVAYLGMAVFGALLAHYSWKLALESWEMDARAMSFLRTPICWPQGIMAFGFTMLAVQAGLMLAVALLESLRSRRLEDLRVLRMADLSEGL